MNSIANYMTFGLSLNAEEWTESDIHTFPAWELPSSLLEDYRNFCRWLTQPGASRTTILLKDLLPPDQCAQALELDLPGRIAWIEQFKQRSGAAKNLAIRYVELDFRGGKIWESHQQMQMFSALIAPLRRELFDLKMQLYLPLEISQLKAALNWKEKFCPERSIELLPVIDPAMDFDLELLRRCEFSISCCRIQGTQEMLLSPRTHQILEKLGQYGQRLLIFFAFSQPVNRKNALKIRQKLQTDLQERPFRITFNGRCSLDMNLY